MSVLKTSPSCLPCAQTAFFRHPPLTCPRLLTGYTFVFPSSSLLCLSLHFYSSLTLPHLPSVHLEGSSHTFSVFTCCLTTSFANLRHGHGDFPRSGAHVSLAPIPQLILTNLQLAHPELQDDVSTILASPHSTSFAFVAVSFATPGTPSPFSLSNVDFPLFFILDP